MAPTRITGFMANEEELPENEDLDSEGIPPLEGALHEKELTGDAQEGIWPPRDRSVARRVLHQDDLDHRLRAERPDRVRADDQPALVVDDEPETGDALDAELADDEVYPSAEEAAVHITENPPGAVDRNVDSYTGEPINPD
ncbi:MAG TPA: hypothetical protein VHW91_07805 [Candidatus Dormibacteraeota bacterium]|nr:hypothetical protein [Candidatus Dormibacteraeota bacterium]